MYFFAFRGNERQRDDGERTAGRSDYDGQPLNAILPYLSLFCLLLDPLVGLLRCTAMRLTPLILAFDCHRIRTAARPKALALLHLVCWRIS
jgi:hypothetical protein